MSDVDPQTSIVDAGTNGVSAPSDQLAAEVTNIVSQSGNSLQSDLQDDINPRSPKRRRLSEDKNDTEIDFEAAAARALAISLGIDQPGFSASPSPLPTPAASATQSRQDGITSAQPPQSSGNVLPPEHQTRLDGLAALDDLANQILSTLAKMSHVEIGEMLFGPPSQRGQDYRALKVKYEQAKRPYLVNSPFISTAVMGLRQADHIDILRKANMATFMASIFSGEIGLRIMDINFLDVFVPEGGRLLKAQASIYLELKTQAFIAAKRTAPSMLNQVMLDLFPNDMEKYLTAKRPGGKSLAPSELDFLKRLGSRRDILYGDMRNKRLDNLELRYRWDDFSREVNSYLAKNYDQAGLVSKDKEPVSPNPARVHLQQEQMESQFTLTASQTQAPTSVNMGQADMEFNIDDFMAQAARAAEIAMQGEAYTGYAPVQQNNQITSQPPLPSAASTGLMSTPTPAEGAGQPTLMETPPLPRLEKQDNAPSAQTEFQQYKPALPDTAAIGAGEATEENTEGSVPHQSQTAPTQVLYERARLVTTNKVSPSPRKPNPPNHRRPWTNEEENALMTGLDQVKGPHWSQILAMYGPGGTINESLKDRNQVQLKDKARNLKLFFLKAGIEVPYYLQAVTGDLKTRAPAQAEKREAKERERINAEDDDLLAQQDELQTDLGDELDIPLQLADDHEEASESTPVAYQEVNERQDTNGNTTNIDIEHAAGSDGVFDMEAMIARAAASAAQSLENPWP